MPRCTWEAEAVISGWVHPTNVRGDEVSVEAGAGETVCEFSWAQDISSSERAQTAKGCNGCDMGAGLTD